MPALIFHQDEDGDNEERGQAHLALLTSPPATPQLSVPGIKQRSLHHVRATRCSVTLRDSEARPW